MTKWKQKGICLITVVICLILTAIPVWATGGQSDTGDRRVFDEAGLLTAAEVSELEAAVIKLRSTMKMDVVLVTTDHTNGKNTRDYADDFYDAGGFGRPDAYSGVLFLIDMENRQFYISTTGAMQRFLTDERIGQMLDNAYGYAQSNDFFGMMNQFLSDTGHYFEKGIPGGQYNYDTETGKISRHRSIGVLEALISLAVAAVSGAGACLNVKRDYAMKQQRQQASNFNMAYRANAGFAFHNQNDVLANTSVTQRIIPRATGGGPRMGGGGGNGRSSTHTSSSGRSHGGGGRGF